MRWLRLLPICLIVWLLMPVTVSADDPTYQTVTVVATGWVVQTPIGFTVTYVNDYEVNISWSKPETANNTMIRAKYGDFPEDREDGYLVYYGTNTSFTDTAVNFYDYVGKVHYAAWTENTTGDWSPMAAQAELEGPAVIDLVTQVTAFNEIAGSFFAFLIVITFIAVVLWRRSVVLYALGAPVSIVYGLSLATPDAERSIWVVGVALALIGTYFIFRIIIVAYDWVRSR